ncbi:hypothetical protein PI125_g19525 [Phytophthora idaei]|nr:hypothetical protein PI125_g19525 [Phytophthora idaei]KAG3133191.1 hypothetical protein PI126_g19282 [Phytophthora idaei]
MILFISEMLLKEIASQKNVCGQCASPVECAREVIDLATDRTRTKRQLGEPSEPTKCPLKGAKSHPAP